MASKTELGLTEALSAVETAVANLVDAGVEPVIIALALSWYLNEQVRQAIPHEMAATVFKLGLIDAPKEMQDTAYASALAGIA